MRQFLASGGQCIGASAVEVYHSFLSKSKYLLVSLLQSPRAVILEPKKRKSVTASTFSCSIGHEVIGPDAMILIFW